MTTISQNAGAINTPDFAGQAASATQQRKIADLLRAQQAKEEMPEGKMVSGHYVAPSWTQYLAPLLKSYDVGAVDKAATGAENAYAGQVAEARKNWQSALPQTIAGQAEVPNIEQDPSNMQGPTQEPFQAAQAAVPEQRPTRDAILKHTIAGLAFPGNEAEAKLVGDSLTSGLTRKEDQDYKDIEARFAAAERKAQALEVAGFNQAAQTERNNADNRRAVEVAAMMAAVHGSAAQGKLQDQRDARDTARQASAEKIDGMLANLDSLKTAGGVTSKGAGVGANAVSYARNSPLGQTLGRITGSPEQTSRDDIRSSSEGLLVALKSLAGLSGTQLDSRKEAERVLTSIKGGENVSAETTNNALYHAAKAFGLEPKNKLITPGVMTPSTSGLSSAEEAELAALKAKHGR